MRPAACSAASGARQERVAARFVAQVCGAELRLCHVGEPVQAQLRRAAKRSNDATAYLRLTAAPAHNQHAKYWQLLPCPVSKSGGSHEGHPTPYLHGALLCCMLRDVLHVARPQREALLVLLCGMQQITARAQRQARGRTRVHDRGFWGPGWGGGALPQRHAGSVWRVLAATWQMCREDRPARHKVRRVSEGLLVTGSVCRPRQPRCPPAPAPA